jgi:hypothetical protein
MNYGLKTKSHITFSKLLLRSQRKKHVFSAPEFTTCLTFQSWKMRSPCASRHHIRRSELGTGQNFGRIQKIECFTPCLYKATRLLSSHQCFVHSKSTYLFVQYQESSTLLIHSTRSSSTKRCVVLKSKIQLVQQEVAINAWLGWCPPVLFIVIFTISIHKPENSASYLHKLSDIVSSGALAIASQGSQWGQFYDQLSERDFLMPSVFFSAMVTWGSPYETTIDIDRPTSFPLSSWWSNDGHDRFHKQWTEQSLLIHQSKHLGIIYIYMGKL